MALIDTDVRRTFATGIAGFSHVIDSLSAIIGNFPALADVAKEFFSCC